MQSIINSLETNEKIENISKKIEVIKKNQMEIIELKIKTEINYLLNGLIVVSI